MDSFYLGHRDHVYAFSSKSGSEPFRALGDLTWNDPIINIVFSVDWAALAKQWMTSKSGDDGPAVPGATPQSTQHEDGMMSDKLY